jgi:hypothetical protein
MPGSGGLPPGGGPDSGSTPSSGGQARPSSGKAKRLFMSGKASQVHTTTKPAEHGKIAAKADDPRGNFADLLREVETLGVNLRHFRTPISLYRSTTTPISDNCGSATEFRITGDLFLGFLSLLGLTCRDTHR